MNFIEDIKSSASAVHLVKYYQFYLIKTWNKNFTLYITLIEKCGMALR